MSANEGKVWAIVVVVMFILFLAMIFPPPTTPLGGFRAGVVVCVLLFVVLPRLARELSND